MGQNLRHTVKNLSLAAERVSDWLWLKRNYVTWSAVS